MNKYKNHAKIWKNFDICKFFITFAANSMNKSVNNQNHG
jgi:hypothetical protein